MSRNSINKLCNSLSGKTVLITGASEGIGFQTALSLAAKDAKVIMTDNNEHLARSKMEIIQATNNCKIVDKFVDFKSLTKVRSFVKEIKQQEERLDVLINNIGVFCLGKERTEDGLQATMQVNHFGPFLLTYLLADILVKSAPSRVIFVSSIGAFWHKLTCDNINNPDVSSCNSLSSLLVYYNSKLCNMITANGFARKLKKCGVTANSVHPGMTGTNFLWKSKSCPNPLKYFIQNPEMGGRSSVFLATSPAVGNISGKFFVDMKEHQQPSVTEDSQFCDDLWAVSECFVNLTAEEKGQIE